jgi:8-oxo-dGTP pyrophosphatase MutT (NUDIX family)
MAVADAPQSWPVVSSTKVFDGMMIDVRHDVLEGVDGGTFTREIISHGGAVAIVAVDERGRVLVLRQYRHAPAERLIELPAGLLDVEGEEPLAAAKRELAEEAGLAAESWRLLLDMLTSPGFTDERVLIYLAENITQVAAPEDFVAEHEEADMERHWVELDALVDGALHGSVRDGILIAGSLALWAYRRGKGR